MGALVEAVIVAEQDNMAVRHQKRWGELVLDKLPEAFGRVLIGEPPAKV